MVETSIGTSVEEPLGVSIGIDIVLQNKVVLIFGDLDCHKQIAGFKARFKDQSWILIILGDVVLAGWQLNLLNFAFCF